MDKPLGPYGISHFWFQSFLTIFNKKEIVEIAEIGEVLDVPLKKILPLIYSAAWLEVH